MNGTAGCLCEPPFADWHEIIAANQKRRSETSLDAIAAGRSDLRPAIISSAIEYTRQLNEIANSAGLSRPPLPLFKPQSEQVQPAGQASSLPSSEVSQAGSLRHNKKTTEIVMSGHQPTIFHPGIVEKCHLLSALVDRQVAELPNRVSIFVLIDTDEGDGGAFSVPNFDSGEYSVSQYSISKGKKPFLSQYLIDLEAMKRVFDEAQTSLENADLKSEATLMADIADRYQRLGCNDIVAANSIVRRSLGIGADCLEVPLSALCGLSQVKSFFEELIRDGDRFHSIYNQALATFRAEHKIKNTANPFPSLSIDAGRIELPFWLLDRQTMTRKPLFVDPSAGTDDLNFLNQDDKKIVLAPRGMMITVLLRLLASDLFIHGTGGAKYDVCTDMFVHEYFGCEAPQFVVATATRYLLGKQLAEAESKILFPQLFRQMCSHTDRFLGNGTFSSKTNEQLRPLVQQRSQLVQQLTSAKQNEQPAGTFGGRIGEIDKQVKQILSAEFHEQLDQTESISKSQLKVLRTREFPFFLHSPVSQLPMPHQTTFKQECLERP